MKRITVAPRPDWQSEMARIGFNYHSIDGNYWQEDACYVFTESQIDLLEDATNTLHHMYVQTVAHVVKLAIMQDLALMISPLSRLRTVLADKHPVYTGVLIYALMVSTRPNFMNITPIRPPLYLKQALPSGIGFRLKVVY